MPREDDLRLLTLAEACDLLGVCRQTIWRHVKRGDLKVVRIGRRTTRFRRADIDEFINKRGS